MLNSTFYLDWIYKRNKKIISHFGHKWFKNKKILDLGSGNGDTAVIYSRLGAHVTCVDARDTNVNTTTAKHPYVSAHCIDLEESFPQGKFDLALCLGLLCHIKNYEKLIENICNCSENIVIETEILDSQDPDVRMPIFELKSVDDLSFSGEGSIVSSANIQKRLDSLSCQYKRYDDAGINSGSYTYDWIPLNNGERKSSNRRMWVIKRDPLLLKIFENNKLLNELSNIPTIRTSFNELKIIPFKEESKPISQISYIQDIAFLLFNHQCADGYGKDKIENIYKTIENIHADIFVHTFSNDDMILGDINGKLHPHALSNDSNCKSNDIEDEYFYSLSKVISIKEQLEIKSNNFYKKIIFIDLENVPTIDDINKLINTNSDSSFNIINNTFCSSSLISDLLLNIYNSEKNKSSESTLDIIENILKEYSIDIIKEYND